EGVIRRDRQHHGKVNRHYRWITRSPTHMTWDVPWVAWLREVKSIMQNRANALAFMEQIKGLVDLIERHVVGDELINLDLAAHVLFHVARQLAAALHSTKSRALPDPSGHQLERAGRYLLTGAGHADDDGFAPTFV